MRFDRKSERRLKAQSTGWGNEWFQEMQPRWFWKYAWKNLQKFIRGRAQRRKCSATLAPIQVLALLISLKLANSLPMVSKTVGILAKTHKNVFWVKYITQICEFADIREINRAKTWIGASVAEHFRRCALPRINFWQFFHAYFQNQRGCISWNHSFPQPVD